MSSLINPIFSNRQIILLKNKKIFYRVKITDNESNTGWLRIWGEIPDAMQPYTIWLTETKNDPNSRIRQARRRWKC